MRSVEGGRFESKPEVKVEHEPELEMCLRRLTVQVVGKEIDTTIDRYLIHQVNNSHVANTPQGSLLKCQVEGCAAECILAKKSGVLKLLSQSGTGLCEQELKK